MEKEKIIIEQKDKIDNQNKIIKKQKETIKNHEAVISDLKNEMKQLITDTEKFEKKEHKFNVKAWLLASIFSIGSLLVGIINLIFRFVKV